MPKNKQPLITRKIEVCNDIERWRKRVQPNNYDGRKDVRQADLIFKKIRRLLDDIFNGEDEDIK